MRVQGLEPFGNEPEEGLGFIGFQDLPSTMCRTFSMCEDDFFRISTCSYSVYM